MDSRDLRGPLALSYLNGTQFSENMSFTFDFQVPVQDRMELLVTIHLIRVFLTFRAAWIIQSSQERSAPRIRTAGPLVHTDLVCMRVDIGNQAGDSDRQH